MLLSLLDADRSPHLNCSWHIFILEETMTTKENPMVSNLFEQWQEEHKELRQFTSELEEWGSSTIQAASKSISRDCPEIDQAE